MHSRHLELIRSLSEKNREKEEHQRREELRRSRRVTLLRDRLTGGQRPAGATASSSSSAPVATEADQAAPTVPESAEERKQRQARANHEIERRQSEALQLLASVKQAEKAKQERAELKRQWKVHKAKQYLVEKCQDANLREHLEKQKPLGLPKLPPRGSSCTPTPTSDREDSPTQNKATLPRSSSATPSMRTAASDPKQSIGKFLERARAVSSVLPCADIEMWKRRNQCSIDKKVFICVGGYPDMRNALLARGWCQNMDKDSPHFDYKWGFAKNIDHENLRPHQVVNHFDRCRDLTTKNGLNANLKNSQWMSGVPASEYYPRAYDLYDPLERADFVLDFKLTKAESVLRRLLEHNEEKSPYTFSMDVTNMCIKICMRLVTDVDDLLDCPELAEALGTITAAEWKILKQVNLDDVWEPLKGPTKKELEEMLNKRTTQYQRNAAARSANDKDAQEKPKKKKKKKAEEETPLSAPLCTYDCPRGQHFLRQAKEVLKELEAKDRQHTIHGGRNAWIVKPSGKSRGRGIKVMRELDEIFRVTESDGFQWICQKYIETPQVPHGYKFDIRQWVLVTDWNPLTVYLWREPYCRFAGKKYDETCTDRSEYVHLVNNSIIKYMDGFEAKNEDLNASGYMWFRQQYQEWMHASYCRCERHKTPFLKPPPYTCETFGVRWEDVAFTAKDEEDDEEDEDEPAPPSCASSGPAGANDKPRAPSVESASTTSGSTSPSATSAVSSGGAEQSDAPAGGSDNGNADAATVGGRTRGTPTCCGHAVGSSDGDKAEADEDCPECENHWDSHIKPQITAIVLQSLLCVVDQIQHRKNSFELYGYDFMVSEDNGTPRVWLIEVNSSPACDYSTPVTCPLVKQMMEDTVKVTVDRVANPACDTGEWELLKHDFAKSVQLRHGHCSEKLEIHGKRIKAPKGWRKKKKKKQVKVSTGSSDDKADDDGDDGGEVDEGEAEDDAEDGGCDPDGDGDGEDDDPDCEE